MTQSSVPQSVAPSETHNPDLTVEPIALALEESPESVSTTAFVPAAILEVGDDRYYANHWGINE